MGRHGRVVVESFSMLVACVCDSVESILIIESIFITAGFDGNEMSVASRIHGSASDSRSPVITANLLKRKLRLRFIS